ncbi:hypothetical protein BN14_04761 [Rhizoctonia solani AG-1 IB]|uniref:Uncharacterized protein n=1 Tax=Thanatephorus cucumeris (strain AG1-IB / isolate 7/3/14) TaxID=1108050 RepID=M5BU29_THACB|nr:hypothetical protein BN14_04761 [Rhizoctonia solani AG-1 IB]
MARTAAKNLKASSKPKAKPLEAPKLPTPPVVEAPISTGAEADAESSDEDSEDSEDDGVDEEGMNRLMKLLEKDGLDDIAEHQLSELGLGDSSEEDSQDEADSDEESEQGENIVDDGDGASESGWVDEDGEMDDPESSAAGKLNAMAQEESEQSEDEEEEEEVVPLDEASEVDEDVVPKQKIVINNEVALKRIRETIELGKDMPWSETLAFTTSKALEIPNADDDLNRELAL